MKKIWMMAIVGALASLTVVSCEKDAPEDNGGGNGGGTEVVNPDELKNQAGYNGNVFNIGSVVYNPEEKEGYTVFYLSPVADLTDVESVERGGEYVRVTVADTSGGNNAFASTENAVEYYKGGARTFVADASNAAGYDVATLSVNLSSATAADIKITVSKNDGSEVFGVRYYGFCVRWPQNLSSDTEIICTEIGQVVYWGKTTGSNAHEYEMLVSTCQVTISNGQIIPVDKDAYTMYIMFYAYPGTGVSKLYLPSGSYRSSQGYEAGTYNNLSFLSHGTYSDESSFVETRTEFDGDISVDTDDSGITTIRAYYLDEQNRRVLVAYQGKLGNFLDATAEATYLPQMAENAEFTADEADGAYYGDMGNNQGTFQITIYEKDYLENTEDTYAATLMLTASSLFTSESHLSDPEHLAKLNGTYTASSSFVSPTWFKPLEMNAYGMVQPFGTFVHKLDGSYYGLFGYAETGTVTISNMETGTPHIEFDFVSVNGSQLKGVYEGAINWSWEPVSTKSDDGTSTLEQDYDLNLTRYTSARLVAPSSIYIQQIGAMTVNSYNSRYSPQIGYQYVAFGNIGANWDEFGNINEGDFVYIEFITAPGEETTLKPGHYTISEKRWPAYLKPMDENHEGVAVYGMLLGSTSYTSHWQHHYAGGRDENGENPTMSIMDGHAYFYGGEVWVEGPDASGDYTFRFDCTCVREHHVRGEWTGPVMYGNDKVTNDSWYAPLADPEAELSIAAKNTWPYVKLNSETAPLLLRTLEEKQAAVQPRMEKIVK